VGGNVTYSGTYGTSTNANAYTSGLSSTGTQFGLKITWSLSDPFPASGTSNINLYVNSNDFYLYIINNNASYATNTLYVNYSLTAQTVDYVDVPNNGVKYGIGYYSAYTNTEIYILSNPTGTSWTNYPSFSFITNQYYTITLY